LKSSKVTRITSPCSSSIRPSFNPHDLKHVVVGSTVIITEKGYLELTSQSFSHYLEEPFDELAFMDDSDDSEEDS
jgi:hypothetical protein